MRAVSVVRTLLFIALALSFGQTASAQGFLKRFVPVKRVESDPGANYRLSENNGPWMVMACTFSGEGAEDQARDLVLEFRRRFNLPAYVHAMEFDLSSGTVGRGLDRYGAPVRMRYRKGDRVQEWAVLVGDFPSVDDPEAQKLLKTIKTVRPDTLDTQKTGGATSQSLANARAFQTKFVEKFRKNTQLGPMRTAFIARNPILPREYFVPKGVDKFVEKMNRGVKHSLLNNQHRYTVKVATFKGQTILQGASNAPNGNRKRNKLSPLEEAAYNAHLLAEEMRKVGYEAYEFHDRSESIVTVGGFDTVAQRGMNGAENPTQEVARLFQIFGAAYNTPADPLQNANDLPLEVYAEAEQRLQSFNQRFSSQHGQIAGGLNPKFARIPPKAPNARVIPFDIHPRVIEVPKKTVSSGFAWRR